MHLPIQRITTSLLHVHVYMEPVCKDQATCTCNRYLEPARVYIHVFTGKNTCTWLTAVSLVSKIYHFPPGTVTIQRDGTPSSISSDSSTQMPT